MGNIKIGYFADGKWAHEAFKLIESDENLEIKFICVRYDSVDLKLKEICKTYDIDYLRFSDINSMEFMEKVKKYECDLFVSMSFNQIFKSKLINIPKLKTINCHAGKLPFYRGRNILNWVLINDENEFGITVHYVDEGIDTGDIILQRTYDITEKDDYGTLLNIAYEKCANVLYDSIKLIQNNKVEVIKQEDIHPIGMYCGIRGEGDEIIDWNQTSREVFNFIRAMSTPGPMARSFLNGKEIKINKSNLISSAPNYKGIVGQIVGKTGFGFTVKTRDSTIEIIEFEYEGEISIGGRLK